jgi:tetratricopeptide (TPR) repeat protein
VLAVLAAAPPHGRAAAAPAAPPDTISAPGRLLVPGRTPVAAPDTATAARKARARARYQEARRLEDIHSFGAAVLAYGQAVQIDPDIKDARYRMGVLFGRGGAWPQAVSALAAEVERDPAHLAAARELGIAFSHVGDHRRAIRQLRLLTERLPDDGASWRALGFACMQAGQAREAERALRKAISLPPDEAGEHRDLGHVLAASGRSGEARDEYRRAIALDPAETGAWVNLGNLERAGGDPAQALADYDQALKRDSSLAVAWKARAQVLFEQRRMKDAAESYRQLLRVAPGDEESRMAAIRLYTGLDRSDVALELARDGVRSNARSGPARMMLGMALEATGDLRSAMRELRRAEAFPADSVVHVRARAMIDALAVRAPAGLLPTLAADSAAVAAELRPAPSARDTLAGRAAGDSLR